MVAWFRINLQGISDCGHTSTKAMLYDGGGVRLVAPQDLRLVPCGDSHADHIGTFWFADIRTPSPSKLAETYERVGDRRRITVIRRRGFGQYALSTEFADGSLGVHAPKRGEGGSKYLLFGEHAVPS